MRRLFLACLAGLTALIVLGPATAQADDTIFDIQLGVYPEGTVVHVDNVVVTGVGKFGYFVQEPDPDPTWQRQWSGIWVFTNQDHTVHKGDVVNLVGTYQEYFNFSEIDVTFPGSSQQYVGAGTIPDPVPCLISEVNDTGALAEAYESVLIRVDRDDPTLYAYPLNSFSEWYLRTEPDGTGDSLLVDQYSAKPGDDFEYDVPAPGTELSFAQGMLVYNYNQYKLAPRNCETDLGTPCKPRLRGAYSTSNTTIKVQFGIPVEQSSAENPANYLLATATPVLTATRDPDNHKWVHLTTATQADGVPETISVSNVAGENGGLIMDPNQTYDFLSGITSIYDIQYVPNPAVDDASPKLGKVVTIAGRLTATEGNYCYVQDGDGTAWHGLYSRVAKDGEIAVGDSVQISGIVAEYYGATQLSYQSGVDNFRNFGHFPPHPVVVNTVGANQIPYRGLNRTAEPWEYCLIKLPNCTLKDSLPGVPGPYFGEWLLRQQTNPVWPDTAACDFQTSFPVSYDPCVGDRVDMTGILFYAYSQYRIAPRTGRGGDIVVLFDNPNCAPLAVDEPAIDLPADLDQNLPNPFGRSTAIHFSLPEARSVSLEVLDVGGRLVKVLASGPLRAGEHAYTWDGTNRDGRQVGSGTYFYRLRSGSQELSRKMVLLP